MSVEIHGPIWAWAIVLIVGAFLYGFLSAAAEDALDRVRRRP